MLGKQWPHQLAGTHSWQSCSCHATHACAHPPCASRSGMGSAQLQKAHMCRAEMPFHSSSHPAASAACTARMLCRAMACSRARAGGMPPACCAGAMAPGRAAGGECDGGLRQVAAGTTCSVGAVSRPRTYHSSSSGPCNAYQGPGNARERSGSRASPNRALEVALMLDRFCDRLPLRGTGQARHRAAVWAAVVQQGCIVSDPLQRSEDNCA